MAKFNKNELEQLLQRVIKGLEAENVSREYGYYASLYPEGVTEADIAHAVRGSRGLHPQMETLVRSIINLIRSGKVLSMWIDEEEQAGCLVSCSLALYDKKYCDLFAQNLLHQDLDHEVNQNDYIRKVIKKWGACSETAKILAARRENPGQSGMDLIAECLARYEEFLEYIDARDNSDGETVYVDSVSRVTIKNYADIAVKSDTAQLIDRIRETPSTNKMVKDWTGNLQWFNNRAIADLLDACRKLCNFSEREKQVFELCVSSITPDVSLYMIVIQGRIVVNRTDKFPVLDLLYQGKGKYVLTVLAPGADFHKWDIPDEFIAYTKQLYDEFKKAKKKK